MSIKKNQSPMALMIQRCHKWRQKRKQYIDQARQTSDEVERERLLQTAEHFCRIANEAQIKIDSQRNSKEKTASSDDVVETLENIDANDSAENTEEEVGFPDFITNLN